MGLSNKKLSILSAVLPILALLVLVLVIERWVTVDKLSVKVAAMEKDLGAKADKTELEAKADKKVSKYKGSCEIKSNIQQHLVDRPWKQDNDDRKIRKHIEGSNCEC